eukprot:Colp12_sorted_trinity150504_noHs@21486
MSAEQEALHGVFVYGSLMSPEVLEAVMRRVPALEKATLRGFQRFRLNQRRYPAIVKVPEGVVNGLFFLANTNEVKILDYFEGDEYRREQVTVSCDGKSMQASVYVWKEEYYELLDKSSDWDFDHFMAEKLPGYLIDCRKCMVDCNLY